MSVPVTEIAYIPIKPSINLETGEGKRIWDATLKTIASQAGFKQLLWGVQIERPGITQMVIDWESLNAHKAFIASSGYESFLDRLAPILDGSPHLFHVKLPVSSHELGSLSFDAPVTECISLYFSPSIAEASYNSSFATFIAEVAKASNSEVTGLIGGWGIEMHRPAEDEGDKKFFGAFVGWPSVESHMEFRKKEGFPGIVGHLKEGTEKVKVHHVAFKRFEA